MLQAHHIYRLAFLILKLIPIVALPKFMDVKDIGTYGAVIGYVYLLSFFSGYEIWYTHNREFISSEKLVDKQKVIFKQFGMYSYTYIPTMIVAVLIGVSYGGLMGLYVPVLTIFTHVAQENSRILISLSRHKDSAILQCIQSLWVVAFPFGLISDVESILQLILFSTLLSLLYSYVRVFKYIKILPNPFRVFAISDFIEVAKPATYLLCTVMCMKLYLYLPRIYLEESGQSLEAGIFTYFQSLATISDFFVQYFVIAVYTPKLISHRYNNIQFETTVLDFFKVNLYLSIGIAFMSGLFGYIYIFYFVSDEVYQVHFLTFLALVVINAVVAISGFYATMLYVLQKDKLYRQSMIYSLVIATAFFAIALFFNFGVSELGITLMLMLVYALSLLLVRLYYYHRVK